MNCETPLICWLEVVIEKFTLSRTGSHDLSAAETSAVVEASQKFFEPVLLLSSNYTGSNRLSDSSEAVAFVKYRSCASSLKPTVLKHFHILCRTAEKSVCVSVFGGFYDIMIKSRLPRARACVKSDQVFLYGGKVE